MQTELGEMPTDWSSKEIGDLEPFVTSGSRGWAAFYSENGSPFVRISNLSRSWIYLNLEDLRFVQVNADISEAVRTRLHYGDVLISITADIGIVGYVSARLPTPAYINQHLALVRFDPRQTDSRFIGYFLASDRPQRIFRALTDSGAKAGMNLNTLLRLRVALPPTKAEQESIAGALSDADALIESLDQLLAKKCRIKQGAMQELLTGKKRLPGFSGEWADRQFDEICVPRRERMDPGRGHIQGFCVELEHIGQGTGILLGFTRTSPGSSLKCIFQKDDVLFGKLRAYLRKYWLADRDGVCSTEIWALAANRPVAIPSFLFQIVRTDPFIELASSAYGTHMPRSDWNVVKSFDVKMPSIPEQTAIATVLSDMDAEIAALEAKLSKARQIKQGMMQELLTGRIRLI